MVNAISINAQILKALSDDTRLKIIQMLSQNELCACNLLESFDITQPTLSYHMKMLIDSKLVLGRKEGVWMKYSLNRNVISEIRNFFTMLDLNLSQMANAELKSIGV